MKKRRPGIHLIVAPVSPWPRTFAGPLRVHVTSGIQAGKTAVQEAQEFMAGCQLGVPYEPKEDSRNLKQAAPDTCCNHAAESQRGQALKGLCMTIAASVGMHKPLEVVSQAEDIYDCHIAPLHEQIGLLQHEVQKRKRQRLEGFNFAVAELDGRPLSYWLELDRIVKQYGAEKIVDAHAERRGELLALMAVLGRAGMAYDIKWMVQEIGRLKQAATTLAATEEALTKGGMTPARGTSIPTVVRHLIDKSRQGALPPNTIPLHEKDYERLLGIERRHQIDRDKAETIGDEIRAVYRDLGEWAQRHGFEEVTPSAAGSRNRLLEEASAHIGSLESEVKHLREGRSADREAIGRLAKQVEQHDSQWREAFERTCDDFGNLKQEITSICDLLKLPHEATIIDIGTEIQQLQAEKKEHLHALDQGLQMVDTLNAIAATLGIQSAHNKETVVGEIKRIQAAAKPIYGASPLSMALAVYQEQNRLTETLIQRNQHLEAEQTLLYQRMSEEAGRTVADSTDAIQVAHDVGQLQERTRRTAFLEGELQSMRSEAITLNEWGNGLQKKVAALRSIVARKAPHTKECMAGFAYEPANGACGCWKAEFMAEADKP